MDSTSDTSLDPKELLPVDKFTPVQVVILLICILVAMLEGFDILIISFTAPAIIQDWSVGPQKMGVVFSTGLLGMALGSMFLASIADIHGRRIVVTVCLLIAGITTFVVQYANNIDQLIILRFIAGLALGTLLSALPTLTGEFSPAKYRNVMIATLLAGTSLGTVLGGLITSAVISEFGWKAIFAGAGLLTMLTGALFYIVVPESLAFIVKRRPDVAPELINRSLRFMGHPPLDNLPVMTDTKVESAKLASLLTPARKFTTLLAWSAFFLSYCTIYFLTSWLPKILVDSGMSQEQGIQGTVILTLGATIGAVVLAWLSRRWKLNMVVATAFITGAVLMAFFGLQVSELGSISTISLWMMLFAIGVLVLGAFNNLYAIALAVYPAQVRSTGLGWCIGLGRVGAVISPAVAGILIGWGISMSQIVLYFAIPAAIAAICARLIHVREMA
jgi:MFS transporter, AAHS family, 4-hydroxybenzoate transporter